MNLSAGARMFGVLPPGGAHLRFFSAYFLDRLASWIAVVTVIVLTFQLTDSIAYAAAMLLVHVLGRAIVSATGGVLPAIGGNAAVLLAAITKVVTIAALIVVSATADIWWAMIVVALLGVTSGIIEDAGARMIPVIGDRRHVPQLNRACGRAEQLAAIAGPGIAALAMLAVDYRAAFAIGAVVSYIALVLLRSQIAMSGRAAAAEVSHSSFDSPFEMSSWRLPADVKVVITGLVTMAAIGVVIRLTLLNVVSANEYAEPTYALLIALVGVGALAGPVPVDRLLGHFPIAFILAGGVGAVAVAAIVMQLGAPLLLVVPAMLAAGLVIVTTDIAAAVAIRRSIPARQTPHVNRTLVRMVSAGQIGALVAIIGLAVTISTPAAIYTVSAVSALAIGVHFLQTGGVRFITSRGRVDADKVTPERSVTG